MEIINRTGQPVTEEELNDAIHAVEQILVKHATALPLFTVNGMAIRRALLELKNKRTMGSGAVKPYPETHQRGFITLENMPAEFPIECDLGIMISEDGRVWLCINGLAFIRFMPCKEEKGTEC